MGGRLSALMSSQLVYGDGGEDIKEFLSGTFSRGGRRGEGGLCSRPVILGAVLTIWLLALSISLIAVASKYQNLSVVSLSSRLDTVDSRHNSNHAKALERTGQEVDKLQGKVRQSLKELKIFLNGMGTVADNA